MVCLYCGAKTAVINSRSQKRANKIWRRRRCDHCKAVFTTVEGAELAGSLRVQPKTGPQEPFLELKLSNSLLYALQDHKQPYEAATELSQTIIQKLGTPTDQPIQTTAISTAAAGVLRRFNKTAYLRYILDHPSQAQNLPKTTS